MVRQVSKATNGNDFPFERMGVGMKGGQPRSQLRRGSPLNKGIRAQLLIAEENRALKKTVPLKNFTPQPKQQARFIAKKAGEDKAESYIFRVLNSGKLR